MNRLSLAFFTAAALCALAGMGWGIVMGATQDFTTMPAHAHLNLVGWASLALMGAFYQLSGGGGRLGWINFGLSTGAVVLMIPTLTLVLKGDSAFEPVVIAASVIALLGMVTFVLSVLGAWRQAKA